MLGGMTSSSRECFFCLHGIDLPSRKVLLLENVTKYVLLSVLLSKRMHFVNLIQSSELWRRVLIFLLAILNSQSDVCCRHGKDNKLIVWKLSEEDEASMSTVLPVDTPPEPRKQPWLLNILEVNTMNFCSFAQAPLPSDDEGSEELLIAVPNTMSSESVR